MVEDHARSLYDDLRDPRLYEFIDENPPDSLQTLEERFRQRESRRSPDGSAMWLNWAIKLTDGDAYAGFVQATLAGNGVAYIGYAIFPSMWYKGYGTEAVKAMINYLAALGISCFCATVDAKNLRSIKLLRGLGFEEDNAQSVAEKHFALRFPRKCIDGTDGPSS